MEAELHIFGSPGRDEMRKWTYPYLEVLAEQVQKMNEIFRRPGRVEAWKEEPQIFGRKDRAELRKQSLRPSKVLAELKFQIVDSQDRTEVRKRTTQPT